MRRLTLPFFLFSGLLPLSLAGCHESYSPNTYAADAAQQEAPVQRGVIVGVRDVHISADGTIGTAAGGAAGGVAGAQLSGSPEVTALGAIGGALVGGVGGAAAEQAIADTNGWEYIVQETNGNLVSITQTSKTALPIGQHVLVIDGSKQARIVPDYTVQVAASAPTSAHPALAAKTTTPAVTKAASKAASNGSTTAPNQGGPTLPCRCNWSHSLGGAEPGFYPGHRDTGGIILHVRRSHRPGCCKQQQFSHRSIFRQNQRCACPGHTRNVEFHFAGKFLLCSHSDSNEPNSASRRDKCSHSLVSAESGVCRNDSDACGIILYVRSGYPPGIGKQQHFHYGTILRPNYDYALRFLTGLPLSL